MNGSQDKEKIKIGLMSDLHIHRKTAGILNALECVSGVDILLLAGDLADRAADEQYELLARCINETIPPIPVLCVSGNHDNPANDDTNYRKFEKYMYSRCEDIQICSDESGAYKVEISAGTDLFGLNPIYHQKQFSFPGRGRQLAYLDQSLSVSGAKRHIIMCHPPLIGHNPQRTGDMPPYFSKEQDGRLQSILNKYGNIIFLSGHTHVTPTVEFDAEYNNLYINDGSICPTTVKGSQQMTQHGNVTIVELSEDSANIRMYDIYTRIELCNMVFAV